ncbi:hypothetical protein L210DRAFT_961386 [Boletus edulis BED1]|uniref:Uncharacterized protein n=1 Tax=Boletus edulis BED1 TaxID=1328754 RepID=A0AAD4BJ42_BOLED|nr:hypothetical protein L210DRAFT_961386 [Boletus edulis BED1]
MALCIVVKHTLLDSDIVEADRLLCEYCTELIQLPHDIGTFLYEQLNKVLKSFKPNNHLGGGLEMTFFTKFHCMSQSSHLMYSLLQHGANSFPVEVVEIMLKSSCEEHGMVVGLAALSRDLDEKHIDSNKEYALSP